MIETQADVLAAGKHSTLPQNVVGWFRLPLLFHLSPPTQFLSMSSQKVAPISPILYFKDI